MDRSPNKARVLLVLVPLICLAHVAWVSGGQKDKNDGNNSNFNLKLPAQPPKLSGKNSHREANEKQRAWYREAMKWWAGLSAWKTQAETLVKNEIRILKEMEKNLGKDAKEGRKGDKKKDKEKDEKKEKPAPATCGKEYKLRKNGSVIEISSPNFYTPNMYEDNLKCNFEIFGEVGCQPSVMCSVFDIRRLDSDCAQEHLEISDGLGDAVKFCGRKGPRPHEKWVSTRGQRDIFITFKSGAKGAEQSGKDKDQDTPPTATQPDYDGFLCTVQCADAQDTTKHYKEAVTNRNLGKVSAESFVEERCTCGLETNDRDRIVGGTTVEKHNYPWQVAIVEKESRRPFCGGALINDRFVLTASHCFPPDFDTSKEKYIEVLLHAHLLDASQMEGFSDNAKQGERGWSKMAGWDQKNVTDADEETRRFKVKEIILHPLYRHGKFDYDVCLLRLAGRVKMTEADSPTPICLPALGTYDDYEGQKGTVVGWGLGDEKGGSTTRLLQELQVPLLPLATCQEWMPRNNITTRMMCAGFEDGVQDACRADSGGPLMRKVGGRFWEQIGVVSWGVGCARKKKPGFYAKVVEMNQWIHHMTSEIETRWCARPGSTLRSEK